MTRRSFEKWRSNVSLTVFFGFLFGLFCIFITPLLSSFDPRDINRDRYGLVEIQGFGTDTGPEGVSVIFVHGLGANANTTWRASKPGCVSKDGAKPLSCMDKDSYVSWISNFLPYDMPHENLRDLRVFQYNHDTTWQKEAHQTALAGLGNDLMHDIADLLSAPNSARKLVFVGSSYGGLIIKQALVHAATRPTFRWIVSQTTGVIFLGTPHLGCQLASVGVYFARALRAYGSNREIVEELSLDSAKLRELHDAFVAGLQDELIVYNNYETRPKVISLLGPLRFEWQIVTKKSGSYSGPAGRVINRGFALDHFQLNKFSSRTYEYRILLHQLLILTKPASMVFFVPVRLVPTYNPRPQMLESILNAMTTDSPACPTTRFVVLHGLGGAGKSQLARQVIDLRRTEYHTVFWIDAATPPAVHSSFARFAFHAGIEIPATRITGHLLIEDPLVHVVQKWFSARHGDNQRWLVVLDGAEDLSGADIEAIIPGGGCGTVLLTSRNPRSCAFFSVSNPCVSIEIGSLEPYESSGILKRHLNIKDEDTSGEEQNLTIAIGDTLGHLALAVDLAGAYINEQSFETAYLGLKTYLSEFRRHRDYLLKRKPLFAPSPYNLTVWTVWDQSLAAIQAKHPAIPATELLTFLSAFDGANIQDELFRLAGKSFDKVLPPQDLGYGPPPEWLLGWIELEDGPTPNIHLREAQNLLLRYSLIQRNEGQESGVKVHGLVQWRGRQVENSTFWADWTAAFLNSIAYDMVYQRQTPPIRAAFLAHIAAVNASFEGIFDHPGRSGDLWTASFFENMADVLMLEGKGHVAAEMFKHAFLIRQPIQGLEGPRSLHLLSKFGSATFQQGRWLEAVHYQEMSLLMQLQWLDRFAICQNIEENDDLRSLPARRSSFTEMSGISKEVISERETPLVYLAKIQSADEDTLVDISDLAITYERLGRFAECELVRLEHLRIVLNKRGENHLQTAYSIGGLGRVYVAMDEPAKAKPLFLRAIEIFRRLEGPDCHGVFGNMGNLAVACMELKEFDEALPLFEESIRGLTVILGESNHETLTVMINQAYLYRFMNRIDQAEASFSGLLKMTADVSGPYHAQTLECAANLAICVYFRGNKTKAIEDLVSIARLARQELEPDHPLTLKLEEQLRRWREEKHWIIIYLAAIGEAYILIFKTIWRVCAFPALFLWRRTAMYFNLQHEAGLAVQQFQH